MGWLRDIELYIKTSPPFLFIITLFLKKKKIERENILYGVVV